MLYGLLPCAEIIRLRRQLQTGEALSYDDVHCFAGSVQSGNDVALLERLTKVGANVETAAAAMSGLFSKGGIGNRNTRIREWFETGDDDSPMTESAPLVLGGCVRELNDGTALRQLFEFADIYDVNVVLDRVLSDADHLPLERILHQSISQQIENLIEVRGGNPTNRFLWTLRTYGKHARVRDYLYSLAKAGRVSALVSYALYSDCLQWSLLRTAEPQGPFDTRLLVNVALENVTRGADWNDFDAQAFFRSLPAWAQAEFIDGYSAY